MLLEKDPESRADFDKIKGHPFFAGMDFEKVLKREYKPEFVPKTTGPIAANFDTEFTMENPMDSMATPNPQGKDGFVGFSVADGGGGFNGGDSSSEGEQGSLLAPTSM
jgi:hypothetical protein